VTLWDVGAERQAELRGADALRFADYLSPRALSDLPVGGCRFTPVCDDAGEIMTDCVVLRPWEDVVWFSHGDVDLELWAHGLALAGGFDVSVREADVPPVQVQGPLALRVLDPLTGDDLSALPRFRCTVTSVAAIAATATIAKKDVSSTSINAGAHGRDAATLPWPVDRARRGISGALSPAIRSSGAESRPEGLAFGVSTPQAALTARSCATWAREPGQVRKEAALSGSRGCRRRAWPEPNPAGTLGDLASRTGARSISS